MRLLRVELRRLFSRRVVWLALLAAVGVVVVALFGVHQQATWVKESNAQAQQMYEEALEYWQPPAPEDLAACRADEAQAREQSGDGRIDFGCEEMFRAPQLSDFQSRMPTMPEQYQDLLGTLVHPFLFLALAIGSTHVAAEFAHRTLGSWLTFVPRRVPVFTSKVGAAAVAAVPMVALALALVVAGVPVVYGLHGLEGGLAGADWTDVAWTALRIVGLAMVAGAFGSAAAFVLRHSGAVIGLMVGYLVLGEGLLAGMFPRLTPWLLATNINAVVQHGTEWVEWPQNCDDITIACREIVHEVSFTHGSLVILGVLLVVGLVALVRFVRADVD